MTAPTCCFPLIFWLGVWILNTPVNALTALSPRTIFATSALFASKNVNEDPLNIQETDKSENSVPMTFEEAVKSRYACTRFERFDGNRNSTTTASSSDPFIVSMARKCLDLARRAPSGFNAQPYKVVLVKSPQAKEAVAKYCIGRNAHRVRDSDCTAIFLADRQVFWTLAKYKSMVQANNPKWISRKWGMIKIQVLITMFSSGFPLPKWIGGPISFFMRLAMNVLSSITRSWYPLPTLFSAETWSQKNTMLVAMTYLLGCSSSGVATSPMEGFNAPGIKRALGIPRRYTIPLIVATGRPYHRPTTTMEETSKSTDDTGMSHGAPGSKDATPRYPMDDVLYGDAFGNGITLA
jgi:nitroreductase